MTYLINCSTLTVPCPPADQFAITEVTVQTLAEIGITGSSISYAIAFGFALIVSFGLLGFVVGSVMRLIRSI